jgi:hypothetical protein
VRPCRNKNCEQINPQPDAEFGKYGSRAWCRSCVRAYAQAHRPTPEQKERYGEHRRARYAARRASR